VNKPWDCAAFTPNKHGYAVTVADDKIFAYLEGSLKTRANSTTKYASLSNAIRLAVSEKILLPGTSLPSERKLAEKLRVSRITIRNSIDALVSEGLLVRRQGARTCVSNKVRKQISNMIGFSQDIRSRGMRPGMRLISVEATVPSDIEREKLELKEGEKVVRLHRVRLANERPIAIEKAVLPLSIVKSADAIGPSLYASLDAMGVAPSHGMQRISAEIMNEEMGEILQAKPGTAVLVVERRCETEFGTPVEYTVTHYNAEFFDFVNELQR